MSAAPLLDLPGPAQWALANVGWLATAVFTASYFARRESQLRLLQMAGASLWLLYGVVIGATPVVVANVLVLAAAAWTTLGPRLARHTAPNR